MKKTLKMIGLSIVGLIIIVFIAITLFIFLSPEFGKDASKQQKEAYANYENFTDGKFKNQHASPMDISRKEVFQELFKKAPSRSPAKPIEVIKLDPAILVQHNNDATSLTWFGHSSFLLKMDHKIILLDPVFSDVPSPFPLFGPKRFSNDLPVDIDELPFIDAIIISHDHYDHLDYKTMKKLKTKVGHFFVPLAVGNHLISWGIDKDKITELNWWESTRLDQINLVCTPARHFSGRGLFNRESTLWCSWVIQGANHSVFFSGDSGYDTHFKKIGEEYGPFDISLMECGQYNKNWKYIHMMPEETALAAVDVRSKVILPIHWGGFKLAFHDWTDPVERLLKKANALNIPVTTPQIGETIVLNDSIYPNDKWWLKYVGVKHTEQ